MQREALLGDRVTSALKMLLGRRVVTVHYGLLKKGDDASACVETTSHFIGGEVVLSDEKGTHICLSWEHGAGWPDPFSVRARPESAFHAESLNEIDASGFAVWREKVGTVLKRVDVLASNETPHVIRLHFSTGSVVLGDGDEFRMVGGDDLVIKDALGSEEKKGLKPVWTRAAG